MGHARSWRPLLIAAAMALPMTLRAQSSPEPEAMDGVMIAFEREADYYGGRLVQQSEVAQGHPRHAPRSIAPIL
jgi:hypothetical protein